MEAIKSGIAKTIVALCKELESGSGEVPKLYRAAEVSLGQRQTDAGLESAVQALGLFMHTQALQLMTTGASVSKDSAMKAEMLSKEVLGIFKEETNKLSEAKVLSLLADTNILVGETTKALKNAHSAAGLFRRLDDKPAEATALGSITTAHLVKATAGFNPQLELADKAELKMEQMQQQRALEMDQAMEAAKEIVTLQRSMGNRKAEAAALDQVAMVYLLQGEPEQSKSVGREARSLYQEMNDVRGEAAALQTIINANLQNEEDYEDALIGAKDMVKLFRGRDRKTDEEDRKGAADALQALAKVLLQKYDLVEALEAGEDAHKLYAEIGDKKWLAPCCHTLAQIHLAMQKPAEAIKCARQAVEDYHDAKDRLAEANALHDLALMDMEDLLSEVEKDPKKFSKEHADRLNAGWQPLEESLALYQELKNEEGVYYVGETINNVIERSRQIHIRVAEPIKTIWIMDPVTRHASAIHIFDTALPDMAPEDAGDQPALAEE